MIGREDVVRERPDVEARLLARRVPPEARIVGLVFSAGERERAADAAEAVAAGVARRREHTLLASCESRPVALDGLLGGHEAAGFWTALNGEARLSEVAIRPEERLYVYLPAGLHPPAPEELAQSWAFAAFAGRVRDRGGTLLLFAPEELLRDAEFRGLLDGYIALGKLGDDLPTGAEPPELARLEFGEAAAERRGKPVLDPLEELDAAAEEPAIPAEEPGAAAVEAGAGASQADVPGEAPPEAPEGGGASEAPGTSEAPEVAGAPLADAASVPEEAASGRSGSEEAASGESARAAAGTEELAPGSGERVIRRPEPAAESAGARGWRQHRERAGFPVVPVALGLLAVALLGVGWWAIAREASSPRPFGMNSVPAEESVQPPSGEALLATVEGAPEVPYSVLIASYAAVEDARDRLARLRRADDGLFFVAPTPVRGAIYHRIFAGARADAGSGVALMEELVQAGRKEGASDWDVRPAGLAYRLGIYGSSDEARAAAEQLEADGVPAYVLPAGEEGRVAWQVYAGAYESESAARPMDALLERAGRRAELVVRRGEAR